MRSEYFINILEYGLILNLSIALLVNMLSKNIRNYILGYFVSIALFVLIADVFYLKLNDSKIFYFLLPLFSSLFYGPVLYIYLVSLINQKIKIKTITAHLLPFFIISILYFVIKPMLATFLFASKVIYGTIGDLSVIIYFILGYRLVKKQKSNEKFILKNRFWWFYVSVNVYLIFSALISIISTLTFIPWSFSQEISSAISSFYFSYLLYPIWVFFCFVLPLYSITEAEWLKQFFVSDTSVRNEEFLAQNLDDKISMIIEEDLLYNKRYLFPKLTMNEYSKIIDVDIEDIKEYLIVKKFKNFTELLNFYRVQEFKSRVAKTNHKNYSLIGISEECGFKSKSTFFRVFKELEGETPNEFVSKISV
ncbi:helix-turn-helix domain-containing protein [uncultured Polaribacter sp.]|uniref:AraC family transcriptional regulator n=1 Tax=uncultured Polaribacter sp. TaxID=174711 RepID=UPI002612132A|nr:helix-turn-helix domain-containing protein [uncultured Polaribacter sp.]